MDENGQDANGEMDLDERLGLKDQRTIINTLWRVRRKSYYIGMNLGVDVGTLEVSEDALDRGKALTDVIATWLKTVSPRPTWKALIDALRMPSVGEGVLANEIAEKYCRRQWKSDRGPSDPSKSDSVSKKSEAHTMGNQQSIGIRWLLVVSLVMCAVAVIVPMALSLTGYWSSQAKSIDNPPSPVGPTPTLSSRSYFPHMNDRPTMDQLVILERKEGGNPVRIIERLGAQNFEVGTFLLKDNKGVIMDTIRHNSRGNAEAMNREMFRRWLAGSGASVSWKVLVDTLDRYKLKTLADDVVDVLHQE